MWHTFLAPADRFASRRGFWLVLLFATTILLRMVQLPWYPIPDPTVHDEFSHLLGADTISSGRLSNPTPPLPEFFESLHILVRPTYATKYMPGQSLLLAFGQVFFGHPFWAVILSGGVFIASVYWMLTGWVRPSIALLGAVCTMITFRAPHYWINSYWGGNGIAIGCAFLLGAYPRLTQSAKGACRAAEQEKNTGLNRSASSSVLRGFLKGRDRNAAWILGLALALILYTRPFEGGVLALMMAAWLCVHLWRNRREGGFTWGKRIAVRAGLVVALALGWLGCYNRAVTGSAWTLPYLVHMGQYQTFPLFWPVPAPPPKLFSHPALANYHDSYERYPYDRIRSWNGPTKVIIPAIRTLLHLWGIVPAFLVLLPALLFIPDPGLRTLLVWASGIAITEVLQVMLIQHYMAPLIVLAILIQWKGLSAMGDLHTSGRPFGGWLATLAVLVSFGFLLKESTPIPQPTATRARYAALRKQIVNEFQRSDGRHVLLVRYGANHDPDCEWVYNGADIANSKIIWARDRGPENHKLREHFPDRRFWLLEPDAEPYRLRRGLGAD
ncbi:MAG: hypothetical protein JJE04_06720 [Acidobacteriia bacterium]|nr:hypothetical protein [Terriglobia bacterium]